MLANFPVFNTSAATRKSSFCGFDVVADSGMFTSWTVNDVLIKVWKFSGL